MAEATPHRGVGLCGPWRGVVCALSFCLLASCSDGGPDSDTGGTESTEYATNGARIYYTARLQSGEPVLAAANFGDPPRPAVKSCADCHGADGQGGVSETDSGYIQAPAISYGRLRSPLSYPGGRAYDEATLALTLRTGVRIDGYLMSPVMPRWQLSASDMRDLIDHLKALDANAHQKSSR